MDIIEGNYNGAQTVELRNATGLSVVLCALGAGIMQIRVPDKSGVSRQVTRLSSLGYGKDYHGLVIGRTSGRVAGGTFEIDGKVARLERNNFGVDNLHGGSTGLFGKMFDMRIERKAKAVAVVFCYRSADGEGGYFGNVDITATYTVYENENKITLDFFALPDCKTLLNLTNHAYFDMSGDLREPVTKQIMYINASRYGVLNERLIVRKIADVPEQFDFRTPHYVGDYVNDPEVMRYTLGYDHPFFLDGQGKENLACALYSPLSGIKLSVYTTYPCVVIFGDNFDGFKSTCFECQFHPDGIHQTPSECGICSPQSPYEQSVDYVFSVE